VTTTTTVATSREARQRVSAIRNALALADDLLAQAFAARDWQALGHPSWAAYCAAELPELRHIKLRKVERQTRVAALAAAGASVRDIAAATGASVGTIHSDLTPAAPVAVEVSAAARVRAALADAGPRGLTTLEAARRASCTQGAASGELSRLARTGRALSPTITRGGYGVYVTGGR